MVTVCTDKQIPDLKKTGSVLVFRSFLLKGMCRLKKRKKYWFKVVTFSER